MSNNILIHIPHSSIKTPKIFYKKITISKKEIEQEKKIITDLYTNIIAPIIGFKKIKFKYSRIFCDVERFKDDDLEPMSKLGQGVIYSNLLNGKSFIKINKKYKDLIIKKYYNKHHSKLNKTCGKIIKKYNKCLIIDLHSFSDEMVYKLFKLENNPDICIGIDKDFYDKKIVEFTNDFFTNKGYNVMINYPYKGSLVPNEFYQNKDKRIKSVMIEINKKLYLSNHKINIIKFIKVKLIFIQYFKQLKKHF